MVSQPEVTRAQMGETRAALSEKIESFEKHVVDTVQDAAHAVSQTVEDVKDAVQETVKGVTDNFDLRLQVEHHPWAVVGGAVALGYVGGYLLLRHAPHPTPQITEQHGGGVNGAQAVDGASGKSDRQLSGRTSADGWLSDFGPEIAQLKGLAIGTLLGVVRNMVAQAAPPEMQKGLEDAIDGMTVKLGGEPVHHAALRAEKAVV
jgi:ElaB/YqjD/DUF883 family membrane-anchored ribosome-binding protein